MFLLPSIFAALALLLLFVLFMPRRLFRPLLPFALAMLFVVMLLPSIAFAGTTVDLGDLYDGIASTLQTIVVSLLLLGLGWLSWILKAKWNIDIDLAHNSIAQNAAQNLASRAVALGHASVTGKQIDVKSETLAALVGEFKTALPDVMARFGLTDDQIGKLILAKLPQAVTAAPAAVVTPAA